MKGKVVLCGLLLCLALLMSGTTVFAASGLNVFMEAPESISGKRALDVYVELYHEEGVGAAHVAVAYDTERFSFKKAVLEQKGENDFFVSSAHDGKVHFTLTNCVDELQRQVVKLHFSSLNDTPGSYHFQIVACEVCDLQPKLLSNPPLPSITVTAVASGTSKGSSAGKESASPSKGEASGSSASKSSRVQASAISSLKDESKSQEEQASVDDRVYYIHDRDTSFRLDKNFFLLLIGFLVIVITVVYIAYRFYSKQQEKLFRSMAFGDDPPKLPDSPQDEPPLQKDKHSSSDEQDPHP